MKKCIYIIISVFLTQSALAGNDCDKHIQDYFNKNYSYRGGASAAAELAIQRRCLHARNPIYSDAYEFNKKIDHLFSIDDSFLVRKNLIDYQEAAEVLAKNNDIDKSSKYIDKFNDILIERFDKIPAAKILTEQVERGLISKAHKEELFERLDKYLFKIGKCNPGICEGWGLISTVAGAFPRCDENSCQKNITYENLYFALAKTTNNFPQAVETIEKLLAKDFGSPKSNGEVKTPLIIALYDADYDAFSRQAKSLLDKAQKTINYDYQDAILLPLITQLMLADGEVGNLLPYTKTKYKNIAGLEATLALLSTPLGDTVRQDLRADLEIYYELTSACEEYRYEEVQGEKILRAGTPAMITNNTELDLFLRQRIQNAYWTDGSGGLMKDKATDYWCSPSVNPAEIDPVFASAQIARDFMREGFIDDIILLPLFAFNKIKTVVKGVRKAPQTLKVSYYNDKALEVAQNTRRVEMQIDRDLRRLNESMDYRIAVGQDFMPNYNIGDRGINQITNGKTWTRGSPKERGIERFSKYGNGRRPINRTTEEEEALMLGKKYSKSRSLARKERKFKLRANPQLSYIGYEKSNKLAKALNMKVDDLKKFMSDPELSRFLRSADDKTTEEIIDRIKYLYNKYNGKIKDNFNNEFTFAYMTPYRSYGSDISRIHLVEEAREQNRYLKQFFGYYRNKGKPQFLSDRWYFSPKTPGQSLDGYIKLLGCTRSDPCYALITEKSSILRLYSHDKSKMIRVSEHEYNSVSNLHFHYYEIGEEYSVNHSFILDKLDSYNDLSQKTPQELKDLLFPREKILNSKVVEVKFIKN